VDARFRGVEPCVVGQEMPVMKKQPAIETIPERAVTVLSVSPHQEDHSALRGIFGHSRWALYQAGHVASAVAILNEREIGVVLCDRDLQPGTWIDLLESLTLLPNAPPLIVTSRLADDRLWSEALNLGAYDVLAKPFDRRELARSVSLAWLHWRHREDDAERLKPMRAAS